MTPTKRILRLLFAAAVSITAFVAAPAAHAAAPGMKTVTVTIADTYSDNPTAAGWGRVTSSPAGIDCPSDCQADFPHGGTVTLTVTPARGHVFDRWQVSGTGSDSACGAARACTLTIGEGDAAAVVALLQPQATLNASVVGAGTLTVAPGEAGLPAAPCGTSCSPRYAKGKRDTVTAAPDAAVPGARFVRWSDYRCSPARRSCTLTMDGLQDLNVIFEPVFLTIFRGSFGPVFVSPPGVACTFEPDATGTPTPCRIPYGLDDLATITRDPAVVPEPGHGWFGPCAGADTTCAVRMRKDEGVVAGSPPIAAAPGAGQSMRFGYKGPPGGRIIVKGNGETRTCTRTCTLGGFQRDSRIRIRAKGAGSVRFKGWSDIKGKTPSRAIYVGDPTAVRATFTRKRK